jgi:putative membrane protein
MEPYQWWWGHGMGFMWIFPILFLIVMAVFLLRGPWCWMGRGHAHSGQHENARDILDRRFTSGEIPKEQYEEMKRALGETAEIEHR